MAIAIYKSQKNADTVSCQVNWLRQIFNMGNVQSPSLISLESPGTSSSTSDNNGASTNDVDSTYGQPESDPDFENPTHPMNTRAPQGNK